MEETEHEWFTGLRDFMETNSIFLKSKNETFLNNLNFYKNNGSFEYIYINYKDNHTYIKI
jgi:hypothetical protein